MGVVFINGEELSLSADGDQLFRLVGDTVIQLNDSEIGRLEFPAYGTETYSTAAFERANWRGILDMLKIVHFFDAATGKTRKCLEWIESAKSNKKGGKKNETD